MRRLVLRIFLHALLITTAVAAMSASSAAQESDGRTLYRESEPLFSLHLPSRDAVGAALAETTLNRHLNDFFDLACPKGQDGGHKLHIVVGTAQTNPLLETLVKAGASLTTEPLGEEGFQLLTFAHEGQDYLIVYALGPRGLKHGCQELVFYRLSATRESIRVDWPLNVTMWPKIRYRGCYMLPCWAPHDSLESWQRALRFNSELTLNRNWFWLDGFPVAGHGGQFPDTSLADEPNVQRLIELTNREGMKFLIGGGWFNWQHEKAVGKDIRKGIDYYLAYLDAFKDFHGFYIEPSGEGAETAGWRAEAEALQQFIRTVLEKHPDFEFAMAIGRFNNAEYLKMMAECDPARVYWWWCWGDPLRDEALSLYPGVLRWHTTTQMSEYHGSISAPRPDERQLAGVATSYDPGQGYGNSWSGWGRLGTDRPRDFHPYTIPFFAHQYYFRERCWNLDITEWEITQRLQRRLFDADAPKNAGHIYWWLSRLTHAASMNQRPLPEQIEGPAGVVESMRGRKWTRRTADALGRMEEALQHLVPLARQP